MPETEAQKLKAVRDILATLVWRSDEATGGATAVTPEGYRLEAWRRFGAGEPESTWGWGVFRDHHILKWGAAGSLLGAQRFSAEALHEYQKRG